MKLNVLHLTGKQESGAHDPVEQAIVASNDNYVRHTGPFDNILDNQTQKFDLIIKDRYPHEVPSEVFRALPIIGFIPAFLPNNRGVHSVFWSIYEKTPVGGTIFQFFSNDYDIGIINRFEVAPNFGVDTLRTLYNKIFEKIYMEFAKNYSNYRSQINFIDRISTYDGYPLRTQEDTKPLLEKYPLGIDTPISLINIK